MVRQNTSQDLSSKFVALIRLLTHKVNDTLPPELHSVYQLNRGIRHAHTAIILHPLFEQLGSVEFEDTFTELGTIVTEWGENGGRSMEDRAELAVVMEELMAMQGIIRD